MGTNGCGNLGCILEVELKGCILEVELKGGGVALSRMGCEKGVLHA